MKRLVRGGCLLCFLLFFSVVLYAEDTCYLIDRQKISSIVRENAWEVLKAGKDKDIYSAKFGQSRAYLLPQLGLTYSYQHFDDHPLISYVDNKSVSLELSQVLWSGKLWNMYVSARKMSEGSSLLKDEAENASVFKAESVFWAVLLAQKLIDVTENNLSLAKETLRVVEERYKNGEVPQDDVLKAEVSVRNLEYKLQKAKEDYRDALEDLRFILGKFAVGKTICVDGEMERIEWDERDFDRLVYRMKQNRPFILFLKKKLSALAYKLSGEKMDLLPTVSVVAKQVWNQEELYAPYRKKYDAWRQMLIVVKWDIFDSGLKLMKIKESRAEFEKAKLEYEEAIEEAKSQLISALEHLVSAEKRFSFAQANEKEAKRVYDMVMERYSEGEAWYLDVLSARSNYLVAQLNKLSAVYDYNIAVLKIRFLVGDLVSDDGR